MNRKKKCRFLLLMGLVALLAGCAPAVETDAPVSSAHVHDYAQTVVKPTYTSAGYTLHQCKDCGSEFQDTFTAMPSEVVSSMAQKDYLLPFGDFSGERTQNPEFVMLHFTSAVVLSRDDPYDMEQIRNIFVDYKVSVHYIIQRDGQVLCYIPENLVAYHAGKGTWQDDPKYTDKLNDYAIGIELVAIGSQEDMEQYLTEEEYGKLSSDLIGYTDAQYAALKSLIEDICARNDIPMDRQHIIGHEEYSPKKTDPGELFDWERLFAE